MSFTNQTQHYGLPQYVGTDVPAYLTDFNSAMATIDAGMNAAKTQADSAATAAGQAVNDISALQSTVGTQATQISAAAQSAATAQSTANTADGKADANASDIASLTGRVTELENSSSGIEYIDVDNLPTNQEITQYIPNGKKPVSAVPLLQLSATSAIAICVGLFASNRWIVFPLSSNGAPPSIVGTSVRVYLADDTP